MIELVERFDRMRRDEPHRPLIHACSEGRTLTAADIGQEAETVAATLAAHGIDGDGLILSVAGNRSGFFALILACLGRGVTVMPVDRGTTRPEVLALAARFGAVALVLPEADTDADTPDRLPPHRRAALPGGLALVVLASPTPGLPGRRGAAVLKLTSGSTGLPKATCTTATHLLLDSLHIVEAMGIGPRDTQLALIPLSHAYGLGNLVVPLFLQGTAVVLRESFVPTHVPEDAARHGVRVFPGVPFMFDHLATHLPAEAWPRRLETLISAGARLEAATVRAFDARFGVKIHSFYGTTETGGICYDAADDRTEVPTVGRPLPGVTVTLHPDESAPAGGGRVHVAGNAVAGGYVGGSDEDADGFEAGGFLTGDLGRFDDGGRLELVGRVSAFVNVAGRKVQPDEVERVLREMPAIADVRVVGLADARRGQQLVACIVARGAVRPLAIRQFCATRLAPHKIPRAFVFLEAFPVDIRGKTNRRALEALVEARLEGQETEAGSEAG